MARRTCGLAGESAGQRAGGAAVNNVETLLSVLEILRVGGPSFASVGTENSTGTRLFCLSGSVTRPGLYEYDFGVTLRAVIDAAGGVRGGRPLRAVLLGGTVDVVALLRRITQFFRDESCGQCVPCRVGTVRQEELIARLSAGSPRGGMAAELALLDARISTEYDVTLPGSACVYCGNCIGVCPTGALMPASEYNMRLEGTWDESAQTVTTTICPYCGVGCNLELHVQDNTIIKVTSPMDHDVTHGHLCVKGRFGFEFVQRRARE